MAAPWAWDLTAGENPFFGRTDENCYLLAGSEASLAVPSMRLWRYANEVGWASVIKRSPENGAKLKQLAGN